MKNKFDKREIEIVSIRENRNELKPNSPVSSPFDGKASYTNLTIQQEITEIKTDLAKAIEQNDIREIFDYFDIGVFINRDGTFGISEYRQPSNNITFSDIEIQEEKLIENVVKISGNADFRKSSLTSFGKIQYIGGRADFRNSNFKPDMKMPKINGKIIFYENQNLIQGILIKIFSNFKQLIGK